MKGLILTSRADPQGSANHYSIYRLRPVGARPFVPALLIQLNVVVDFRKPFSGQEAREYVSPGHALVVKYSYDLYGYRFGVIVYRGGCSTAVIDKFLNRWRGR